jgi:hypothetical protein
MYLMRDIQKIEKILDNLLRTVHTLATLVRHPHWGVARGSDRLLGQGLEPTHFLRFCLTSVKSFSILSVPCLFATPLVSAGKPAILHSQAVLIAVVDTASLFFCIGCYLHPCTQGSTYATVRLVVARACASANVADNTFQGLIRPFEERMIVLSETAFHAAEGDPSHLKLCQRGEWQDRLSKRCCRC